MNFLSSIRADLVEKRLLPVAIVLAAVAVLVPVGAGALSSSGSSQPVVGPPSAVTPPPGAPSPARALDAVAGPGTPAAKVYKGRELDPFRLSASAVKAQAAAAAKSSSGTAAKTSATTPVSTTKTTTTTTTTPKAATPKATTPKATTTPNTTTTTPATPTTPVATPSPKAELARLTSRQSYSVTMNVVDASGARTVADAVRLSPLPSASNPLVEYLGVLKSGRGASYLVNPGTVAQGPGLCLPSASDCQLLVLKPGQIEALGVRTSGAPVMQASIAVSGWHVVTHSSVAAARKARAQVVPQGRTLVAQSAQPALTDLVYTVTQGAVSIIPSIVSALPTALAKLLGG